MSTGFGVGARSTDVGIGIVIGSVVGAGSTGVG